MNTTWDYPLFLSLNFDGGALLDQCMLALSGKWTWVPLYVLILFLIYKQAGWRNLLLFLGLAIGCVVLTDMVAGIFKHNGLLGALFPHLSPRLRPMYTPELQGTLHIVKWGGQYGTVSAHAATTCSVALFSGVILARRWFWWVMALWILLVCYSRIYLAYHFPQDILYGLLLGSLLAWGAVVLYRRFRFTHE